MPIRARRLNHGCFDKAYEDAALTDGLRTIISAQCPELLKTFAYTVRQWLSRRAGGKSVTCRELVISCINLKSTPEKYIRAFPFAGFALSCY